MFQQAHAGTEAADTPRQSGLGLTGVRLTGVGHAFPLPRGELTALEDVDLEVPAGSFTAIIGPNGCGKSTLLRLVAGLLMPTQGSVELPDANGAAAPRAGDGQTGLAFQQPRLMPWLSTLENVALPLTLAGAPAAERRGRAELALERVGLAEAADLRPADLSGGMAQRAGLARALITDPPILLLDEPFSALDALTREAFDDQLQRLWLELPRTVLFVTHSVSEAIRLADRVVVMSARPGSVADVLPVDLPRPRPVQSVDPAVAALDAAVRAALARSRPPELTDWTEGAA
ncbi:MAG TPA: ABC transporter ATP-binding protein [Candidatus Limnocylindria bacterium]|nr:ABC transporter ATP-binding protein [Candidatus Limnocylindria bacterium]